MPGFFFTFVILCFAAGWGRYLSNRSGQKWPLYPPGAGLVLWSILTVFAMATSMLVSGTGTDTQGDGLKLSRVLNAAIYARYISIAVLVAMVPVTLVAWLRPVSKSVPEGNA